ncbi:MAG: protein translocase subunit SecD [Treponema sp.]|nr:protein translocase subunit SecD [Treponema sp.]MBQ2551696.1 protein translocase subunit SecD [Treponema sp.]MBQ4235521.1 protein translocase subunit SecD [Treponema sp.]MBQ5383573.1 protein translocase subunit SecD [Treponema sp.]
MNKKSRFILILAVLAICFGFLWPSLKWYAWTPKEDQALALSSLENIKDYASVKASDDVAALKAAVKADPSQVLAEDQKWLLKAAKSNYKLMGESVPNPMTLRDALASFSTEEELRQLIEGRYREKILADKKCYQNSVKLGLDLSGGMNVIVKADLDAVVESQKESGNAVSVETLRSSAMAQAIETLSSRIDRFGLSSPTIRQQGDDRIYIEIPGSAEADQINSIIMGRGILNFRLVDTDATNSFDSYYNSNRTSTFDSQGKLIDPSIIPEDCEVLGFYTTDDYGLDQREGYLVVKKEIILDGKHIKSAEVGTEDITGKPQVSFKLDTEGAQIFAEFTSANVGKSLAIVSDDRIKSNAVIRSAITGGAVAITGFGQQEAQNLQKVLQTAWLDVPLTVENQQVIGASLGEKAIKQGVMAIAIGLAAIMLFMLLWYHGAGINACVAQVLNLYIMFSILSALNLTITLPSIAGMILTIGMAVDANVIIFERIKEERRLGKDRASSISSGFGNALWAILDSNITTFIAAAFMSQLGSGSIQGFAYSLAIGVVSTVFTALVVSRLMFDFGTETVKHKGISIGWGVK